MVNKITKRQCANCCKQYKWRCSNYRPYDTLFYHTCKVCTQTCSECGEEIGYCIDSQYITAKICDICGKEPCMSCGVTVFCHFCQMTCCVNCIDDEKKGVCEFMMEKKAFLDTKK